jgi:hypothetical protein
MRRHHCRREDVDDAACILYGTSPVFDLGSTIPVVATADYSFRHLLCLGSMRGDR